MCGTHCQVDLISVLTPGVEWGSVHLCLEKSLLGEPALLRGILVRTELGPGAWEFGEILMFTVTPLPAGMPLCLRHRPANGPPGGHGLDGLTNSALSTSAYHTSGVFMTVIS